MDPQTIERALKRCIDISTRLGALEDELPPPAAGRVIVKCVDDIDEMQRWLEGRDVNTAGGRFGRIAHAGRRIGLREGKPHSGLRPAGTEAPPPPQRWPRPESTAPGTCPPAAPPPPIPDPQVLMPNSRPRLDRLGGSVSV